MLQVSVKPYPQTGSPQFCIAFQDLISVPLGKSPAAVLKHSFFPSGKVLQVLVCHHRRSHGLTPCDGASEITPTQTFWGILVLLFGAVNQEHAGTLPWWQGCTPRWRCARCTEQVLSLLLCQDGQQDSWKGASSSANKCTASSVAAGRYIHLYIQLSLTPARMEISLFPRTDSRVL